MLLMLILTLTVGVLIGAVIGYGVGRTHAEQDQLATAREKGYQHRIAALERTLVKLHGPDSWERDFERELERDELRPMEYRAFGHRSE